MAPASSPADREVFVAVAVAALAAGVASVFLPVSLPGVSAPVAVFAAAGLALGALTWLRPTVGLALLLAVLFANVHGIVAERHGDAVGLGRAAVDQDQPLLSGPTLGKIVAEGVEVDPVGAAHLDDDHAAALTAARTSSGTRRRERGRAMRSTPR